MKSPDNSVPVPPDNAKARTFRLPFLFLFFAMYGIASLIIDTGKIIWMLHK